MIFSKCYNCCHEKICRYKREFQNAVKAVYNVSYVTDESDGRRCLLEDSPIVVELKCPHYMCEKGGREE